MKKFLGILIISISLCGNAKSFFHKDPFVSWNFDKGYVYVALQNNQNLNEEINRGLPLETISKLNCSNGLKKIKLKTLPPGYAEDVPELLKKKFQPLNMYKFSCATAVVEKPKKQEPEIKFNSLDLKETLVYWGLKIDNYFFTFNDRGSSDFLSGNLTIKRADTTIDAFPYLNSDQYEIAWEPKSSDVLDIYMTDDNFKGPNRSFKIHLDFDQKIAIMSTYPNHNDKKKMKIFRPEKLFASNDKKDEKPKKKKPKSTPDDDKIVPAGSGSGFFVSKEGHAITNYHVIEGCDVNKLSFKGSQTEVKVLAVDKVNDIAILKSNAKPDVIFPVSNEDVSLLEDVIVAGFPLGKQISSAIKTHKGVVTALAGAGDNYSYFQTDAAINQGNSGGPIINQKGNVVGIAVQTWVEEGVQGVHFGIKSSTLKTFASANGLNFASPNYRDLSNKDLGKLITQGTIYIECHMTVAKIKKMLAQAENRKAFFKEHK